MMRVWLKGTSKTYVLVQPPFPEVGDVLNLPDGEQFEVKKIREEDGFEIKFPAGGQSSGPDEGEGL